MLKNKDPIAINENGEFHFKIKTKGWNSDYAVSLIKYLNLLHPAFSKAKNRSDFEFITTLLGFRGMQDAGWDPFENTITIFNNISTLKPKDEQTKINLFLWVYGHIIEASEPYEILANFFRIINGERFSINNFPDIDRGKYQVPMFPAQKIDRLQELAEKINMQECLVPIKEIFNRQLRNGIFHSDYSIYKGGVRIKKDYLKLNADETYMILNKALAYIEAFKFLYNKSISDYKRSIEIPLPEGFFSPKGVVMVRKNHGVVGLKDNWTKEQLSLGCMPFRLSKLKLHERLILDIDPTIADFPVDKTESLHDLYIKLRSWVPKPFKHLVDSWYNKELKSTQKRLISEALLRRNKE
jgi:hypothetical protein